MSEPTDPPVPNGKADENEKKTYAEPRLTELGSLEEQTRVGNASRAAVDRGSS